MLPGGVDSHVHIEQPGGDGSMTADDFESGTRAAACGGTTTIMPFAMQFRGRSLRESTDAYRRKADFIQRYIFPGGMLMTPGHMDRQSRAVGLSCDTVETFGASYAATLRAWRERFEAAWPALMRLGFDERFRLMWLYYFMYCEAGFDAGATDVGLYRVAKPA